MRKAAEFLRKIISLVLVLTIIAGIMPTIEVEAASVDDRLYHIDLKIDAEVTYNVYKDGVLTIESVDDAVVSNVSMYYTSPTGEITYIFLTDVSESDKSGSYKEYFMYGWSTDPQANIQDTSRNRETYRQSGNFAYGGTVTITYTMEHTNPITGELVSGTYVTTQTLTTDTNVCSERNNSGTSRGFDAYVVHEHNTYESSEKDMGISWSAY